MVLLQPKLHLKVSQRQILTPGLVQMVSVLALNKLELRDMITAEMVENPVLEELEDSVPLLDDAVRREEERERVAPEENTVTAVEKKDPFEEIDFGSFFQEYLDPGYRSRGEMEEIERPSFENFLSKPTTLSDHLAWQLGALSVTPEVREAAEIIIGNLSEDGYLIASDEELLGIAPPAAARSRCHDRRQCCQGSSRAWPCHRRRLRHARYRRRRGQSRGRKSRRFSERYRRCPARLVPDRHLEFIQWRLWEPWRRTSDRRRHPSRQQPLVPEASSLEKPAPSAAVASPAATAPLRKSSQPAYKPSFNVQDLHEALDLVRQMDPPGVACRDLRDCLLYQLRYHQQQLTSQKNGNGEAVGQVLSDAAAIVDQHLRALQNKQYKEIARAINRPPEAVQEALEYIRTLDPRPGLRYNKSQPRLIEPDVAFIKHGDEWLVMMNEDDVPVLRLNPAYKRLLTRDGNDKDTRNYVKERYKSAIQLIKNIEQRKQTITKVCYSIVTRQQDFLEKGIDQLKPMMIKEVAEEIGVHPSTVSRAVANKYAHTPQGVFELRYFFSESVNGPQGGNTSLLILKRRVKKLIEEEDPNRPLTDEQITRILQSQGIQVTRRTVAKYREDMRIPSTHQRRVKK